MPRYIDADALKDDINNYDFEEYSKYSSACVSSFVIGIIDDTPTAEVQKVKRGRWKETAEYVTTAYGSLYYFECSCCSEQTLDNGDYCTNCGAIMEGAKGDA